MWHITDAMGVTDYHAVGEPFRIVTDRLPIIGGTTVAERRVHAAASSEIDAIRQLLCQKPRSHADMYDGFITPPDDDADFGVRFGHKDGYSTVGVYGTIIFDDLGETPDPTVQRMAYATGTHLFTLDQTDPVGTGFVLR